MFSICRIAIVLAACFTVTINVAKASEPIYVLVAQSPRAFGDENVTSLSSRVENAELCSSCTKPSA